tara:strand:+ start:433 stop:726 length:294 start_codon:yes stop_codon:yes gene_type:complete
MKHFEDVWNEAERISSETKSVENAVGGVINHSNDLRKHYERAKSEDGDEDDVKQMAAYVGALLFDLTRVCKEFNINSWTELEKAVNDAKIDLYDEES